MQDSDSANSRVHLGRHEAQLAAAEEALRNRERALMSHSYAPQCVKGMSVAQLQ